jgi:hypothetical protein
MGRVSYPGRRAGGRVSRAARSLLVFGIYLEILAAVLVFAPNALLSVFGVVHTDEVWIRVLGVVVGCVGIYYIISARHGFRPIIVASVPVRLMLTVSFIAFVLLDYADPAILVFGVADLVGAVWTAVSLRSDASSIRWSTGPGAPATSSGGDVSEWIGG